MKSRNICKFVPTNLPDTLDIHCFIYESEPETMKKQTRLTSHRAILVKCGKGEFLFDGKGTPYAAGSLVFGFSDEQFCVDPAERSEYMYIDFSGNRAETLFHRFGINRTSRIFLGFDGVIPLWHDSLTRASQENIDIASESILLYTFSRMNASSAGQNNLIERIVNLTEENFNDPQLSISAIAAELSYNYKYISHLFKEKMGMSYSEYLRTLRIKYAVSLFDHGIDSVKNVAFLSGFSDPLYFSTVFKNSVGVTPKEYKNRNTKPGNVL